jgi:hypothetical protein
VTSCIIITLTKEYSYHPLIKVHSHLFHVCTTAQHTVHNAETMTTAGNHIGMQRFLHIKRSCVSARVRLNANALEVFYERFKCCDFNIYKPRTKFQSNLADSYTSQLHPYADPNQSQ